MFNSVTNVGFQNPATPIMEGIVDLHNYIFFFLVQILVVVVVFFSSVIIEFHTKVYHTSEEGLDHAYNLATAKPITHHTQLEFFWTILPTFVLVAIAIPSIILLYSSDEVIQPTVTVKAIGSQWFWSYEYTDPSIVAAHGSTGISFDSYMLSEDDLPEGGHRLLEVDNSVVLPTDVHIRMIVTANDVLHSFAVPALGVKIDAVPGRLNQTSMFIKREGVFYGQCSELCGVNHGFMPIAIVAVSPEEWLDWALPNNLILFKARIS